jgi:hypothetical protein
MAVPVFVSDKFARANGPLGSNWGSPIPNHAEFSGWTGTPRGNIAILNGGVGPDNTNGLDCAILWNGGQTFAANQWTQATIKTVAAPTATLTITAATQSGGNTTYTYTVASGAVALPISGGALYVIVSGMQNAGNDGNFVPTSFGAGTFTVANASGVTEAGSSGTGFCASDSGAGVGVRMSGTSAATLNGYFFHVGTNSFGGGGRKAYYELWKVVNGVGTILVGANDTTLGQTLPQNGDVIGISVVGSAITAFYNGVILAGADPSYGTTNNLFQTSDTSIASGGGPGIWAFAVGGEFEYVFADWSSGSTQFAGNNGTTITDFRAGDSPANNGGSDLFVQGATGAFSTGGTVAFPSNNTAHNILIAQQLYSSGTAAPGLPTDSQGNSYNFVAELAHINGNTTRICYVLNCKAGANTVTFPAQAGGFAYGQIAEYTANANASLDNSGVSVISPSAFTTEAQIIRTGSGGVLVIGNLFTSGANIPAASSIFGLTSDWAYNTNTYPTTFVLASAQLPVGVNSIGAGLQAGASVLSIQLLSFNLGYSISGSTAPGTTISYTGTSSGSVTADGNGNFSINGLANGSYTLTPSIGGHITFVPASSAVTVSGASVTGIIFGAVPSQVGNIILTKISSDNFTRANENPLSQGGNWATVVAFAHLQVLSDVCEATSGTENFNYETYNVGCPANQYVTLILGAFTNGPVNSGELDAVLRADATADNGYYYDITANDDGTTGIFSISALISDTFVDDTIFGTFPCGPGTSLTVAIIGSTIYCILNGQLIGQITDTQLANGAPQLQIAPVNLGDMTVTYFEAGSAALAASGSGGGFGPGSGEGGTRPGPFNFNFGF